MIYTKKGDKGETGLFKGERVSKSSLVIDAIGCLDEANSFLGIIGGFEEVQKNLMLICATLAGAKVKFASAKTKNLEKDIDRWDHDLPKLKNFILPGGGRIGAKLHFARTLVRRAERAVVAVPNIGASAPSILIYINRLSDYLFMAARSANFKEGKREVLWQGK